MEKINKKNRDKIIEQLQKDMASVKEIIPRMIEGMTILYSEKKLRDACPEDKKIENLIESAIKF